MLGQPRSLLWQWAMLIFSGLFRLQKKRMGTLNGVMDLFDHTPPLDAIQNSPPQNFGATMVHHWKKSNCKNSRSSSLQQLKIIIALCLAHLTANLNTLPAVLGWNPVWMMSRDSSASAIFLGCRTQEPLNGFSWF